MSFRLSLAAATLTGLALRVLWFLAIRPERVGDAVGYQMAADIWTQHGALAPNLMPGYIVWTAACGPLAVPVNLLLSALACLGVAYLARTITDKPTAVVAAWIVALHPEFIAYASVLHPRHVYAILMLVALAWAWRGRMWAGAWGWLSVLFRGDAYFMLPVLCVTAWKRRRLGAGIMVGVMFAGGLFAGWKVAPAASAWQTTFHESHRSAGYGPVEPLEPFTLGNAGLRAGLQHIRDNPWLTLRRSIEMPVRRLWAPAHYGIEGSTRRLLEPGLCDTKRNGGMTHRDGWFDWYRVAVKSRIRDNLPGWVPAFRVVATGYYLILLALSALFILQHRGRWLVLGIVGVKWIAHGLVFSSTAQYRYFPEMVLCVGAAWTITEVWSILHTDWTTYGLEDGRHKPDPKAGQG